jgi:hypothetical protein
MPTVERVEEGEKRNRGMNMKGDEIPSQMPTFRKTDGFPSPTLFFSRHAMLGKGS